jgi:hypothetical protein
MIDKGQTVARARTAVRVGTKGQATAKSKNEGQAAAKATAGPSTASFAKCANDFTQDDRVLVVGLIDRG